MADPVAPVVTNLVDVEQALESIAKPQGSLTAGTLQTGSAAPQPALTVATGLLTVLYNVLGTDLKTAGTKTAVALGTAVTALRAIAKQLQTITSTGTDVQKTLQALQNALAVAQTILPGASPDLASGGQFFGQLNSVLTALGGDVNKTVTVLYQFAQELAAVQNAIQPH